MDASTKRPKDNQRRSRESALNDTRRSLILGAAREAFFELGLDGASLREIAKRAGYTPGALYSHFRNLEEIYAALLGESLERLNDCVGSAAPEDKPGAKRGRGRLAALLRARAMAFFAFYRDNPRDMDLGFYLFNGAQPRGLTPELNQRLNHSLISCLSPIQQSLVELGLAPESAIRETTAIFAHAVGLLVLNNTGRIRLFRQDPTASFACFLDELLARICR